MTSSTAQGMGFIQVALSVTDFRQTVDFYCNLLGFKSAGWTDQFEGEVIAQLQGLSASTANVDIAWLVDQQDFFNIEVIQYIYPITRVKPKDARPSDIGYTLVFVHVQDFDATLARLSKAGVPLVGPIGRQAGARRATIQDPDGVFLELWEQDIRVDGALARLRPEINAAVRGIRASVPNLEQSTRFFVDVLGMQHTDVTVHTDEDEAGWGLGGAKRDLTTLVSGDYFIELAQYRVPKPTPRSDDYDLSDRGFLNIALGSRARGPWEAAVKRVSATAGAEVHLELPLSEVAAVTYVDDPDGFSVELTYMEESADKDFGLVPVE